MSRARCACSGCRGCAGGARCERDGRRGGVMVGVVRARPCVAGCSHQRSREACECRGAGRLGCRGMYSRRFTRMMGSWATARLGSIS